MTRQPTGPLAGRNARYLEQTALESQVIKLEAALAEAGEARDKAAAALSVSPVDKALRGVADATTGAYVRTGAELEGARSALRRVSVQIAANADASASNLALRKLQDAAAVATALVDLDRTADDALGAFNAAFKATQEKTAELIGLPLPTIARRSSWVGLACPTISCASRPTISWPDPAPPSVRPSGTRTWPTCKPQSPHPWQNSCAMPLSFNPQLWTGTDHDPLPANPAALCPVTLPPKGLGSDHARATGRPDAQGRMRCGSGRRACRAACNPREGARPCPISLTPHRPSTGLGPIPGGGAILEIVADTGDVRFAILPGFTAATLTAPPHNGIHVQNGSSICQPVPTGSRVFTRTA